jgi:hypothetical protein
MKTAPSSLALGAGSLPKRALAARRTRAPAHLRTQASGGLPPPPPERRHEDVVYVVAPGKETLPFRCDASEATLAHLVEFSAPHAVAAPFELSLRLRNGVSVPLRGDTRRTLRSLGVSDGCAVELAAPAVTQPTSPERSGASPRWGVSLVNIIGFIFLTGSVLVVAHNVASGLPLAGSETVARLLGPPQQQRLTVLTAVLSLLGGAVSLCTAPIAALLRLLVRPRRLRFWAGCRSPRPRRDGDNSSKIVT